MMAHPFRARLLAAAGRTGGVELNDLRTVLPWLSLRPDEYSLDAEKKHAWVSMELTTNTEAAALVDAWLALNYLHWTLGLTATGLNGEIHQLSNISLAQVLVLQKRILAGFPV